MDKEYWFSNNVIEPDGMGHIPTAHSKGGWKPGYKKQNERLERMNESKTVSKSIDPEVADRINRLREQIAARGEESPLEYWNSYEEPE